MAAEHEILLADAFGNNLAELATIIQSARATRVAGAVGVLELTLPWEKLPDDFFQRDHRIYWSRGVAGRSPSLLNETWYLIRKRAARQIQGGTYLRSIWAYDLNTLLARRIVAYAANTSQAKKSAAGDNMIKAVVRENLGTLATDTARNLSAYIAVQADLTAALTTSKAFSWRDLLPVLQEIAATSTEQGTYLTFDMVATSRTGIEFRTYTGQRGVDHRRDSTSPIVFSPENGNLADAELIDDWSEEATAVYAGAQGERSRRNVQLQLDQERINTSPFNRVERFLNATHIGQSDTAGANDEAYAGLRDGLPLTMLTGRVSDQPDTTFGLHYGWGDRTGAGFTGRRFNTRLDAATITLNRAERELHEAIGVAVHAEEV